MVKNIGFISYPSGVVHAHAATRELCMWVPCSSCSHAFVGSTLIRGNLLASVLDRWVSRSCKPSYRPEFGSNISLPAVQSQKHPVHAHRPGLSTLAPQASLAGILERRGNAHRYGSLHGGKDSNRMSFSHSLSRNGASSRGGS
jgi:hypothetical protein